MKRKRMTGLLAVIAFLLPLITGMFGFGETSYADAPTDEQKVNVTLHKKKMDQFPTVSEAQRDLRHPVRTLQPDMAAHQLYQQKYQRYQHLIAALQGYHARIKEHTL